MAEETKSENGSIWSRIREKLEQNGVYVGINRLEDLAELEALEDIDIDFGTKRGGIKLVCITPDLQASAEEMSEKPRDKVVMVRVDEETREALDAWVEAGAVKSRSEAAALFIREGLAVRSDELSRLRDALREVEEARERLRDKASEVFGGRGRDQTADS